MEKNYTQFIFVGEYSNELKITDFFLGSTCNFLPEWRYNFIESLCNQFKMIPSGQNILLLTTVMFLTCIGKNTELFLFSSDFHIEMEISQYGFQAGFRGLSFIDKL